MNRNSPVPLWAVLTIGVVVLAGAYALAQRTVAPPQVTASVRRPAVSSKPDVATTATATAPLITPPSVPSDCPVFDSFQDATRQPHEVCYLILGDQGLTEVPAAVEQMTNVEFLFLQDNQLSELPHWIGTLKGLQVIDVDNNSLLELPSEIGDLTNLTSLSAANNQLSTLPPAIAGLSNLQSLNLSRNQLTELPPLGKMTSLEELAITGNDLKALPDDISSLGQLKWLYLRDNHVLHIPLLNRLHLESLGLAGNPVCGSDGQIDSADRGNLPPSATSFAAMACVPILEGQG